jgi:hypothetical protein
MRSLALVVLVVSAFGCDDNEPTGILATSSSDKKVVSFTAQGPCFVAPLFDEEPDTLGLQPSCTGEFSLPDGTVEVLPMCDGTNELCFSLVEDTNLCPDSGLFLSIETSGRTFSPDATATVECLLAD